LARVLRNPEEKFVWHTGKAAGFRAFIERRLGQKITILLLTNKGESKRQEISDDILHILAGLPYVLPKLPGAEKLYAVIHQAGIHTALRWFDSLQQTRKSDYDFSEADLNALGYKILDGDKRIVEAIAVFKFNTDEHPHSSNAFDSLGEAYRRDGRTKLAIECYQKAVALDRANLHAAAMLKELH
jgi:tetratricopeptide (TPR) repeat protein